MSTPPPPPLPDSYTSLPYQHIFISHHPSSSPTPTPVIIITLNRPKQRNAFTDLMASELVSIFGLLSRDVRVKVVVLTGAGSAFCAGADLGIGLDYRLDTVESHRDGGGQVALAIHNCTKPVIAAINGAAVGVGITMTLPCAIRVVSSKAKIGFVFGRRGIVMEACSSFFLPRLVGYGRAMELVTTGMVYEAKDKVLEGLWTEVVGVESTPLVAAAGSVSSTPPNPTLKRTLEIAEGISKEVSSVSWCLMRDLMWRGPGSGWGRGSVEEAHLLESKILFELFRGKDKEEGIKSFLEKREASFQGTMGDAPGVWPWWKVGKDSKL